MASRLDDRRVMVVAGISRMERRSHDTHGDVPSWRWVVLSRGWRPVPYRPPALLSESRIRVWCLLLWWCVGRMGLVPDVLMEQDIQTVHPRRQDPGQTAKAIGWRVLIMDFEGHIAQGEQGATGLAYPLLYLLERGPGACARHWWVPPPQRLGRGARPAPSAATPHARCRGTRSGSPATRSAPGGRCRDTSSPCGRPQRGRGTAPAVSP